MRKRVVICTIDTIMELMKDYLTSANLPEDARAIKLMLRPAERGKLGILAESPQWTGREGPMEVRFQLKRLHRVGG